jgi:two-component system, OmpR family, response regulator MprA
MAATPGVLVIDDDPRIRTVLQAVLTDSGYTVRIASNGGAALALLGAWRPDVILLDLQMPIMDGWTFRRAQLAHEDLAAIPVVVMGAGLAKPFELDELLETVAVLAARASSGNGSPHADTTSTNRTV